jgi:hypothetical protein
MFMERCLEEGLLTEDLRERLQVFYEATASYQSRMLEASSGYNQVVVLAGYAGFFAIWSATADDLPRWVVLLSGALMGVSLAVYVAWVVYSMVMMRSHMQRLLNEIAKGPDGYLERVQKVEVDIVAKTSTYLRLWKPVVWISGVPAALAALLLTSWAFAAVVHNARKSTTSQTAIPCPTLSDEEMRVLEKTGIAKPVPPSHR